MKRTLLLSFFLAITVSLAPTIGMFAYGATSNTSSFYSTIPNPPLPENPAKIRVQEFFWFGCPHCFRLDPLITAWAKKLPKDVIFERVPDNLGNPVGALDEQAFYVTKLLGLENKIHTPLFDAIHIKHEQLNTPSSIQAFLFRTAGISPQEYKAAVESFEVTSKVRRANRLAYRDHIVNVPSIVIAGEYHLDAELPGYARLGGNELAKDRKMLSVASKLIEQVRAERTN